MRDVTFHLVEIDADNVQALRRVLASEFVEQGIFVAAGFAPSRPEIDEQRLAVIALDYLLEALRVDKPRIVRSGGLRRGYGGNWRIIERTNGNSSSTAKIFRGATFFGKR